MKGFPKTSVILIIFIGLFCVACQSETSRRVQNIETFARLYGYARWFHPSDEAQQIDWDKFAVLGVQKVENIQSNRELRDVLYQLFSPIVQGLQIFETNRPQKFNLDILSSPDPNAKPVAWQHYGVYLGVHPDFHKSKRINRDEGRLFDQMPQFGEVINEPIGRNLTAIVPLTLLTNNSATYPKSEASSLAWLKSEIDNIQLGSEFNMQANLASVVIVWNVLQHFFPYFDVIDTDWNSVFTQTLKNTLANKTRQDFYVTLSQMTAQTKDGHGWIELERMYHLPIRTEFIENQIVITASENTALQKGDIIKSIDGKPVMRALAEKERIIFGSPQLRRHLALSILGSGFDLREVNIVIEREERRQDVTVQNSSAGFKFFNPVNEQFSHWNERIIEIESGIFYVNMRNSTEEDFRQKIDLLAGAKAVIYDQRELGLLTFFHIIPHLTEKPVMSPYMLVPQTIYPNRKAVEFYTHTWRMQPRQPLFNSKTIIINSPAIMSSGETTMSIIDHYNLAVTVGETTAGCNGGRNQINTPSGYTVGWTGMKVLKHDGSQHYLIGYAPDYPIRRTIQAVREGRDEALEKALEIARRR